MQPRTLVLGAGATNWSAVPEGGRNSESDYRRAQSPDLPPAELIPVVPALDDLTSGEADERDPPQPCSRVVRMIHDTRPAQHSLAAAKTTSPEPPYVFHNKIFAM